MAFVLNIHAMASELEAHANRFFQMNVSPAPVLAFKDAHAIVMALVDDAMSDHMAWSKSLHDSHMELMKKVFPWFEVEANEEISDRFYCEIFDGIFTMVTGMIDEIIPYGTWDVWDLKPWGTDALLTCGRDYRIVEWERLTKYKSEDAKVVPTTKRATPPTSRKAPPPQHLTVNVTFALRERLENMTLIPRELMVDSPLQQHALEHAQDISI